MEALPCPSKTFQPLRLQPSCLHPDSRGYSEREGDQDLQDLHCSQPAAQHKLTNPLQTAQREGKRKNT
jgi:hypothetical protein